MKKKNVTYDASTNNGETFNSISFWCLGFIDSYRFVQSVFSDLGSTSDYEGFNFSQKSEECLSRIKWI